LEVIATLDYNNRDGVIHAYTLYACVHQSKILAPSSAYSFTTKNDQK